MRIQIIIPAYLKEQKHIAMTYKCLEYVSRNTKYPHEIIIVENSENPTFEFDADLFIRTPTFNTYAVNVNLGLKHSNADYMVVLSNDVYVPKDWDMYLLECFKSNNDCGIATLESKQFNTAIEDKIEEGFFGGIWCISRQALDKIGLLDERFINTFEDADYWIRALSAGYKLYKNKKIQVEHLVGATSYYVSNHQSNYDKNRILFNDKHKDCNIPLFEQLR